MKSPNIEPILREKAAELLGRDQPTLAKAIGIELTEIFRDRVVGKMPVDGRTKQPFGLLHGGASVALAETLASIGGWLNVDEKKFAVVGIEINANHLRSVTEGWVIGVATPVHRGAKTHVWEIKISTEQDRKPVCISRCTLAVIELER